MGWVYYAIAFGILTHDKPGWVGVFAYLAFMAGLHMDRHELSGGAARGTLE